MLIDITSKPWKAREDSYPTMDAIIDGHRDRLVQRHPDGSLWMDHMYYDGERGTVLEYVPVPDDATVKEVE